MRSRRSVLAPQSFGVFLLHLFFAVLLGLSATGALAQPPGPFLLGDLFSEPDGSGSSYPQSWIEAGDEAFFIASRSDVGAEWYVTRGTPASTVLLADSSPGDSSTPPTAYGLAGGRLFWWAEAGEVGGTSGAVWTSDGSPASTRRVTPPGIGVPAQDFRPRNSTLVDGVLYFVGCSVDACAIWMSDGTPTGTVSLHQLPGGAPFGAEELAVAGGTVFYTVSGDLWAFELSGGDPVRLVQPGPVAQTAGDLTVLGSKVFFSYENPDLVAGPQVWSTDGTIAGTHPVSDFSSRDRVGSLLLTAGPWLYFLAETNTVSYDIWRSDGTLQGTESVVEFMDLGRLHDLFEGLPIELLGEDVVVVGDDQQGRRTVWGATDGSKVPADLVPCQGACPELFSGLVSVGGRVLFLVGSNGRTELWATDGTPAGTVPLKELCGADCGFESTSFSRLGGEIGFTYSGRAWISDGTAAGTRAVTGPAVNVQPGGRDPVGRAGSCYLFPALDLRGVEPWCSDGSPASAHILRDLHRSEASSDPRELVRVGDRAVFSALDANGVRQVWSSDGRPGSSASLRQLTTSTFGPFGNGRNLTGADGFAIFGDRTTASNVWRTDGTVAGTFPVGTLDRGREAEVVFRGRVYSLAGDPDQYGIWEIDGTPGGVRLVVPLEHSNSIHQPVAAGDAFYFQGPGDDLWRSDGTPAGTYRVAAIPSGGRLHQRPGLAELDGLVYFVVDYFGLKDELWRTDGSPDSGRRVADLPPFEGDDFAGGDGGLHAHAGALYLRAANPTRDGVTLYRYTAPGLVALLPGSGVGVGRAFASLGSVLYFVGSDGVHGFELWRTDGTVAGTRMVEDLHEGGSSSVFELAPAGDRLFFSGASARAGRELWVAETSGAVRLVADLVPGAAGSDPRDLLFAGDALFFTADDGEHGREPWALPLAGSVDTPPLPAGPFLTDPAVPGFRFKVRISTPSGDRMGEREADCIPETLCVSGALPGRSEVFLRVVGPKPNGKLWPTLVKFSTSRVEVWVEQAATGQVSYYDLAGASPGVDELPGLFDRTGFDPAGEPVPASLHAGLASTPSVAGLPLTSPALPGFTFRVEVTSQQGQQIPVRVESDCIEETVCLSGAIPGRSELFLRVVGPKPNGKLWPTLVRFSTSTIDVWITQDATGVERHYRLEGASPGSSDLSGLFDRAGFDP